MPRILCDTHTHVDLLRVVDDYLREREARQYRTRIGKVKSHTNIEYNDAADAGAKDVATGKVPPDIIFDEADPERRGLRTWLTQHQTDSQGREREIVIKDLKDAVKPLAQKAIQTQTTFGTLLREAIAQGAVFSVQPASAATHKQRRLAYEIAWGVHAHRLKRLVPQHQHAHCRKCGRILTSTNSHMVAGCGTHTRLRTARHHSTFTLLVESLQHSDGGRWPLLAMDLGTGPIKDFEAEFQKAFTGPGGEEQHVPTTVGV